MFGSLKLWVQICSPRILNTNDIQVKLDHNLVYDYNMLKYMVTSFDMIDIDVDDDDTQNIIVQA